MPLKSLLAKQINLRRGVSLFFWGYNFFARRRQKKPLNMPVLVISGGQDLMFSEEMGEALAAVFPKGKHLHLPDAGHLMIAEFPEVINQAIATFIEKLS